jgi:hypothetical protein
MEFLASDAMLGRESASQYELIAAMYIAAQLREAGVEPAGDNGSYLQQFSIPTYKVDSPPLVRADGHVWTHGKDVAFGLLGAADISGPLQKVAAGTQIRKGAIAYVTPRQDKDAPSVRDQIFQPMRSGAAAVLVGFSEPLGQRFDAYAKSTPDYRAAGGRTFVMLGKEATAAVEAMRDGVPVQLQAQVKTLPPKQSRNVIGVLRGTTDDAILLSAHMDHLGAKEGAGDVIFNGADDDASGVSAVLELARALAAEKKRQRTVYFLFAGSEEIGLFGGKYFAEHPPVPLPKLIANLEFEMIARPDPKIAAHTLWMAGFDRSTLGPELARHGARLVADPHPEQQFFQRSDNYELARKGIIAHGVSSFGLHSQYHQPDDDLAHVDFAHMTDAIQSLIDPVVWLVNSDFKPEWLPGKKP